MRNSLPHIVLAALLLSASAGHASGSHDVTADGLTIKITDTVMMKPARVSVAVTREPSSDSSSTTIGPEVLLNSELRGHIENPSYYFDKPDPFTDTNAIRIPATALHPGAINVALIDREAGHTYAKRLIFVRDTRSTPLTIDTATE